MTTRKLNAVIFCLKKPISVCAENFVTEKKCDHQKNYLDWEVLMAWLADNMDTCGVRAIYPPTERGEGFAPLLNLLMTKAMIL